MNKVIMQGNLTKDAECQDVGNSRVCKINLACNRSYKDVKETCFIECISWGNLNKVVEAYTHKGKSVLIEGRLKLDTWTSKDGEKRYKHVVVVENLVLLGGPGERKPVSDANEDLNQF